MKKIILTLLGIVVVLGLFAAAGYAGYRIGYAQGRQTTTNGSATRPQQVRPFDNFGPRGMPGRNFGFGFGRGFHRGFGGFPMVPMMGFGFFSPLMFLGRILVFALIVWFIYWLFTRSGWRLTRTTQTVQTTTTTTPPPANTEEGTQDTGVNQ